MTPKQPTPHGQDGEKLREQILSKIELAVRTQFFNDHQKNMQFLADDLEQLFATRLRDVLDSLESEGPKNIPIYGLNVVGNRLNEVNDEWRSLIAKKRGEL